MHAAKPSPPPAAAALTQLQRRGPIETAAEHLIGRLPIVRRPGSVILAPEGSAQDPVIVAKGWAARAKYLPDGRRQILTVILPGDALSLNLTSRPIERCELISLTPIELLDAHMVREQLGHLPLLARALWLSQRDEEQRLIDQVGRLGRRTAMARICSLLLEFRDRMIAAGLGDRQRFEMPLTQEAVADVTALSVVHVNRTLQQLRSQNLLEVRNGQARFNEPQEIEAIVGTPGPRRTEPTDQRQSNTAVSDDAPK